VFNQAGVGAATLAATAAAVTAAWPVVVVTALVAAGTTVAAIALTIDVVNTSQAKMDKNLTPTFEEQGKKLELYEGRFDLDLNIDGPNPPVLGPPCSPIGAVAKGLQGSGRRTSVVALAGLLVLLATIWVSQLLRYASPESEVVR
jgi:hypothetical protein